MSKTIIFQYLVAILGFLVAVGALDQDTATAIRENAEQVIGGAIGLVSVVNIWFRTVTDSPVAKGLRGWLGIKA